MKIAILIPVYQPDEISPLWSHRPCWTGACSRLSWTLRKTCRTDPLCDDRGPSGVAELQLHFESETGLSQRRRMEETGYEILHPGGVLNARKRIFSKIRRYPLYNPRADD